MIQHSGKNDVLGNTSDSKNKAIILTSDDIDIEMAFLCEKIQAHERHELSLNAEIKKLTAQTALLNSQNQCLHNCWQSAIENHIASQAETRAWISRAAFKDSEIGELRRQVEELKSHLNPSEEAA